MPKNRKKRQKASSPSPDILEDVKILSGDGVRMAHSESIVNYVQRRDKNRPFYLSNWLKTLSDKDLEALKMDAYGLSSELRGEPAETVSTEHGRGDALNTAMTVYMVETGQPEIRIEPEKVSDLVTALALATSLITLTRKGLLTLHAPLSIQEDQSLKFSMPKKSIDAYAAFKAGMH